MYVHMLRTWPILPPHPPSAVTLDVFPILNRKQVQRKQNTCIPIIIMCGKQRGLLQHKNQAAETCKLRPVPDVSQC